ncbi:hypothetical protein [Leclercia adecarboxylata]|uniref:hypothetical protein n=1 Tax=Leclercia adecarboxylata TaxID=83655 RepID=UPI002948E0D5|nr:hypothetical protein [Leclercia adecarboxylata]MDV5280087.1 hypothetical protein [Leclercia adecarboxylata]
MKKHDRGWATLDTGLALVVLMVVVVFGLSKFSDWQQQKNWQIDAARTSAYAAAARAYVGHNYVTLLNASTDRSDGDHHGHAEKYGFSAVRFYGNQQPGTENADLSGT